MTPTQTLCLYALTACAEILGCYLSYLWLKKSASPWWLIVAAASLALFVWLLTLHPHPAGRVYAAYGGVYIAVSVLWLWLVDGCCPIAGTWLARQSFLSEWLSFISHRVRRCFFRWFLDLSFHPTEPLVNSP